MHRLSSVIIFPALRQTFLHCFPCKKKQSRSCIFKLRSLIMATPNSKWCVNLRLKCFLIGYMNLIASIVDIASHVAIVAIITNGFQCDPTEDSLKVIDWPWLEPFLLIVNMGTHGFYPFPLILKDRNNPFFDYQTKAAFPRCYPGMLHVNLIDVLNFMINIIWLKFVKAYVVAVHRKDPEPMRMFFGLSLVKLVLQIMYFTYNPNFNTNFTLEAYWLIKAMDIVMAFLFLIIIDQYIKQVRAEKSQNVEQPPPYIECLINVPGKTEKGDGLKNEIGLAIPEENTKTIESISGRV